MLLEKIEKDFREALNKKQAERLSVLRMLKTELHNKEINLKARAFKDGEEQKSQSLLTDEIIIEIIQRGVKQRKESIELFKKGKREDLAQKENEELEILSQYLPKQLSDDKIKEVVLRVIEELAASGSRDFGKVMGRVMTEVKGKAEGVKVNQIVKELLMRNE